MRATGVYARSVSCVVAAIFWLVASLAQAQTEPSAGDRAAAGQAYDRGTAAYLAHEYTRAATLFETAYRLAPSAPALIQAIRAHEHANETMRAGSLALQLHALYSSDRQAERQAQTTLHAVSTHFLHVDVTCDATCTVELDGTVEDYTSFFVDPASAHTIRASFDTGVASPQTTSGAAGTTQTIVFARPAPPPPPIVAVVDTPPTPVAPPPVAPPPRPSSSGGVHPAVFLSITALTLAAGAVLAWSTVDMYDGVGPYRANPTMAGLQDGQSRELRTDVMWGVTGGLAATAVILAIVTDWNALGGSSEHETVTVTPVASPSGGGLVMRGAF